MAISDAPGDGLHPRWRRFFLAFPVLATIVGGLASATVGAAVAYGAFAHTADKVAEHESRIDVLEKIARRDDRALGRIEGQNDVIIARVGGKPFPRDPDEESDR